MAAALCFAFGRFRTVLDFGQKLGLNPECLVRDLLGVGLDLRISGDILGNVYRPAFGGVEADDADRIAVPATQQVLDDGPRAS
jgi:hypothetical protein